jgi:hypothetical protein
MSSAVDSAGIPLAPEDVPTGVDPSARLARDLPSLRSYLFGEPEYEGLADTGHAGAGRSVLI